MKKHLVLVLALFIASILGCSEPNSEVVVTSPPPEATAGGTLTLSPGEVTLPAGEPAQFAVVIASQRAGSWHLTFAGAPHSVSAAFDSADVIAGQTAVMTVTADQNALDWSGTITVTAVNGIETISTNARLIVEQEVSAAGGGGGESGTGGGATGGGATGGGATGGGATGGGATGGGATGGGAAGGGAAGGGAAGGGSAGGGGGTSGCPGYSAPAQAGTCACPAGHACDANNCYGGFFCDLANRRCVPPPAGCAGTGGGSTGGGGGSTGGGGGGSTSGGAGVGPTGGTVPFLHFGITGDTRPPNCEDTAHYPTAIISGIADALKAKGAQFVVDEGDHMFVCNGSLPIARAQMALFTQSTARFGGTWFMAMGNHECWHGPCLLNSTSANYVAYMEALAPVSRSPYYAFNVETQLGRAAFIIIADNAWDSAQQTWLQQELTQADLHARYTFVFRHHPEADTSVATNTVVMSLIRQHKFALFISGHSHEYKHQPNVDNGRDIILGLGGAPLLGAATWNGYAMIDQQADGRLKVSVFDLSGGTLRDSWYAAPNP